MKVLLWYDQEALGKRGDVVEVSGGYARNYLFPRRLATVPTPAMAKELERAKKRLEQRETRLIEDLKQLAARLEPQSVTLEVKANAEGKLYGSVTPAQIAEALQVMGLKVEPKAIQPEHPIREVGVYSVPVKLHPAVHVSIKVWVVVAQEAEARKEK